MFAYNIFTLFNGTNSVTLANLETLTGGALEDTVFLTGNHAMTLNLGAGADTVHAGQGLETITLGAGNDYLVYTAVDQSTATARDVVTDFNANGDILLFSGLLVGNFAFVGAGSFSGGSDNSEARFNDTTKLLQVDTNGDGAADMEVALTGVAIANLSDLDFIWI